MLTVNSTNRFADHIISLFASQHLILDSVTAIKSVKGKNGDYLLVRIVPPSAASYDTIRDSLIELLRDDKSQRFPFRCFGQVILDADLRKNLVLKIWQYNPTTR